MIRINTDIMNVGAFNRLRSQLISEVLSEYSTNLKSSMDWASVLRPLFKTQVDIRKLIQDIIEYDEVTNPLNDQYNIEEYLKTVDFYIIALEANNRSERLDILTQIYSYASINPNIRAFIPNYLLLEDLSNQNESIRNNDNYKKFLNDTLFKEFIEFSEGCKKLFDYDKFISSNQLRAFIITAMNIKICPYCNEALIQTIDGHRNGGQLRVLADIDHFLLQSKVPLFSLTFSNFIPSCYVCNRGLKGQSIRKILNPKTSGFENKAVFLLKNPILKGEVSEVVIRLQLNVPVGSEDYNRIENSKDLFELEERYNHSDILSTIIKLYRESRRLSKGSLESYRYILEDFDLEATYENIYFHIFGFNPDNEEFINIRLGKLKSDIFNAADFGIS